MTQGKIPDKEVAMHSTGYCAIIVMSREQEVVKKVN